MSFKARLKNAIPASVRPAVAGAADFLRATLIDPVKAKQKDAALRAERRIHKPIDLTNELRRAGLPKGKIVFVHSSLNALGYIDGGAKAAMACLHQVIVEELGGTLAMPAFSMAGTMEDEVRSGRIFDVRKTSSGVGKINEMLRLRPDARRSLHPTHSVAAVGPDAEWLTEAHHTAPTPFGPNSPLGRVYEADGILMGLGTDLGPVTFYHVVEDYRDDFPIDVYTPDGPIPVNALDANGRPVSFSTHAHDPSKSGVRIDKKTGLWIREVVTDHLQTHYGLRWEKMCDGKAWIIPARAMFDGMVSLMTDKGLTIYSGPPPKDNEERV